MKKNFVDSLKTENKMIVHHDYEFFQQPSKLINENYKFLIQTQFAYTVTDIHSDLAKDAFKKVKEPDNPHGIIAVKDSYSPKDKDNTTHNHLRLKQPHGTYDIKTHGKTLYPLLGQIDFYDRKNLMDFVKVWGLPCCIYSGMFPYSPFEINNLIMNLEEFYRKLFYFQKAFSHFHSLINSIHEDSDQIIEGVTAQQFFENSLTTEMDFNSIFKFKFDIYHNNGLLPYTIFDNLFEVAYFYLTQAVFNGAEMRVCQYCENLFEVTHQSQRFCPPVPNRKRSSCEMAYNNNTKMKGRNLD
ncbi:hypothetical protein D7Z54_29835 [Salibacterium salarium]|uniref:Uncharacterized protein n=1 Tax=Salibacterium salarium TaxID=284579 RepID=A0A3R9WMP7_9BACI|nr:hypothetical protein [Salibacterium salarium]RSL29685.1 hypothetical protein D7Z54_29835 [Salibacterium salarium]